VIVLTGRNHTPSSLAFSPDGTLLACGGTATHVQLWDLTSPGKAKGVLGPKGPNYGVTFLADDHLLSAACLSGYREYFGLRLARRPFAATVLQEDPGGSYWDARPTGDGRAVVLTQPSGDYPGVDGSCVVCRELPGLKLRWVTPAPHRDANAVRACLCSDGRVVVNFRIQTLLLDGATGEVLRRVAEHESGGGRPAVSPDNALVAYGGGRYLTVAELQTGRQVAQVKLPGHGHARDLAFHPGGRLLLAATNHRKVTLYDPTTLAELAAFDWGIGKVRAAAFSPDGMRAAAAGEKGKVVVWDVDL
jgi:WD40 repeat protein